MRVRTGQDVLEYEIRQEQAATIGRLARELRMRSMRWIPLIGKHIAAIRQPIAATRNERVSSMLPRTLFGISSCSGNPAAFVGRIRSSRTTRYQRKCARRWERFGFAS